MKTEQGLAYNRNMKKYDIEFKKECVKRYLDGQSVASISRETGVSEGVLHKWKKSILKEMDGDSDEMRRLRARNLELEMEVEILKKATAYFARDT